MLFDRQKFVLAVTKRLKNMTKRRTTRSTLVATM
jgi:hypothetical protein